MSDVTKDAKNSDANHQPQFFNGKSIGKSIKEVAVDLIKTESEDLVSRWYHGTASTDLFTWADRRNNIIKQQLNFNGQVVEWNCLEGIKTGVVVEQDVTEGAEHTESLAQRVAASSKKKTDEAEGEFAQQDKALSETIHFDHDPQARSVALALEILKHTEIEGLALHQIIGNFKDPQNIETMAPEQFLHRFGLALKNYEKNDSGFWQAIKGRFTSLFSKGPSGPRPK